MFQPSTILPSRTRQMVVPQKSTARPVAFAAERVPGMTAGDVTEHSHPIALDNGLDDVDLEVEGVAEGANH